MKTGVQRHVRVQTREDTIVTAVAEKFGLDYSSAVRYIINDRQRLIALAGDNHRPADITHCDPAVRHYCPTGLELWDTWRHICRTTGSPIAKREAALAAFDAHVETCAAQETPPTPS